MQRDGATISIWQDNIPDYKAKEIEKKEFDVAIVGGGLTGIMTALLLQRSGKKCVVIEARSLGFGTTGGTSAHLNTFFDTPYSKVIKNFGENEAALLKKGAVHAIELIKNNIAEYKIECSFETKDAYLFATDKKQAEELDDIVLAGKKLALPIDYTDTVPYPVPYVKAALIQDQAQFHPVKYLFGIAKAYEHNGGAILQHDRVLSVKEDELIEIQTEHTSIKAKSIIYATHIPPGVNLLHFRCAPYRSYVIAATLKNNDYPDSLGYDLDDPYHYYRSQEINGQMYLTAGGEDHKTAHEENAEACFRKLESYVRSKFDIDEIAFRWSSQYFEPADGLAYIGHLPGHASNVFVATGYGGNGMMYSAIAAMTFREIFSNGNDDYIRLFDPNRIKPVAGFANVVKEGADVVKNLIAGKFAAEKIKELSTLAAGEAMIVKYEKQEIALYKDEGHHIHAVDPACTHINCRVKWNLAEKSWDCPCHGSRFSADGSVLTGPAQKALKKIDLINSAEDDK